MINNPQKLREVILKCEQLSKIYSCDVDNTDKNSNDFQKFMALEPISFDLARGEVLGIVGSNGSGKSTLLKLLGGMISPTQGQVSYQGRLISILDIGSGFHPELTGFDNIFFYGSLLGISKDEMSSKLQEIIEFSEIGDFIDQPVKYYSSGMYLRLAFSVAFFIDVDILLLDEVISVGDTDFMIKCNSRIIEMINSGVSIILISHNMNDILRLCNTGIWLEKGRIVLMGEAGDVASSYLRSIKFKKQYHNIPFYSISEKDIITNSKNLVDVKSVKICNSEGLNVDTPLDYNFPFIICFDLNVKQEDLKINPVIVLLDQYSQPCLITTPPYSNENHKYFQTHNYETYRFSVEIPKSVLNIGEYTITLRIADQSGSVIIDLPDLLAFKLNSSEKTQEQALLRTAHSNTIAGNWTFSTIN